MRRLARRPVRLEERIVIVGVAVRPEIDGDGGDVALRVEAAWAERAIELIANIAFKGLEAGRENVLPADAVLLALRQAWRDRHPHEMDQHGLVPRTSARIT